MLATVLLLLLLLLLMLLLLASQARACSGVRRRIAGMVDVEATDGTGAQVPESIPPEAFDLPISDMFANAKLLANVRTSDAVWELKTKLEALLCGTAEADALRLVLIDDSSDPPKQIDLEIETRTLEEYGVERGSKLMWQAQDPAGAKQRRDDREAERLRVAKAKHGSEVRQATCWACVMVCGAAMSQAGWWSLYGDLGLWGGVIGIPLVLVGYNGFTCVGGHSPGWDMLAGAVSGDLCGYTMFALIGSGLSALACPATGTVPAPVLDDEGQVLTGEWVSPEAAQLAWPELALTAAPHCRNNCEARVLIMRSKIWAWLEVYNSRCEDGGLGSVSDTGSYCPLGSDTADCGCRNGTTVADWLTPPEERRQEYGWSDRAGVGGCGWGTPMIFFFAVLMVPAPLLHALRLVRAELAAMRTPNYERRTRATGA
jgi:hypothetical protein